MREKRDILLDFQFFSLFSSKNHTGIYVNPPKTQNFSKIFRESEAMLFVGMFGNCGVFLDLVVWNVNWDELVLEKPEHLDGCGRRRGEGVKNSSKKGLTFFGGFGNIIKRSAEAVSAKDIDKKIQRKNNKANKPSD